MFAENRENTRVVFNGNFSTSIRYIIIRKLLTIVHGHVAITALVARLSFHVPDSKNYQQQKKHQ